ncbi:MAG: serine--tRNA ligase [Anaerolineae bacterium CG2_30_64_16]|nr:MAG: serine--tRNA ligase [Anaerolineae bacterium CG2_30_64_16]
MLDIKFMRENREQLLAAMVSLGAEDAPVALALALDERRRAILTEVEALRAERNAGSKEIGALMRAGQRAAGEGLRARMTQIGAQIAGLDEELARMEADLRDAMLRIPNLPHPSVPVGRDERENVVVRQEGALPAFDFEPLPHWDLGTALDIIDFERGVKLSGTRFYVLKGAGARLQRALIAWMLDLHTTQHGYTEIYPPYMVKAEVLVGTGNLPKFGDNLYHDAEEDFWWIPTAEAPVTNLYREEILDGDRLPICHVAYTPCFRREKMSAGRDVRGIKRGHQFDKVEMVKFTRPEDSMTELMKLLDNAEDVCRALGIPHRVVQMCTGDLSFVAAVKYDVEMWAPGCGEWLEVSSCANFMDFQARRANIRYRPEPGARPEFVHTMNGSGLALPRVMIALLETYQQADGSILIPELLRPYMGGIERIG